LVILNVPYFIQSYKYYVVSLSLSTASRISSKYFLAYNVNVMKKFNILKNEPLYKHTTFRVGGPAKYFFQCENADDIPELITWAKSQSVPYFILGGGSNVIFNDAGFDGLVIKISADKISLADDGILAEAGAKMAEVARFACTNGLSGLEEFVSIPGTVGGAVYGNAGCFSKDTASVLSRAWILKNDEIEQVENRYFGFKYRWSKLKETHEIVLKVLFKANKGGCDKSRMDEVLKSRKEKQPWGLSAGSFFKNPGETPEMSAGYLIDKCGLKGKKIGGAEISQKHANFIINMGGAKSEDILALADFAKKAVKKQFDIDLQPEVQVVG